MWHAGIHEILHTLGFENAVPGGNVAGNCTASDTVMFHQTSEMGPFPGLTCADTAAMKRVWRGVESPLIMNIHGGQIHLSAPLGGVLFDIAATGRRDLVAWPEQPSAVGFLVMDRNMNGRIDDGRELFGNHTPLRTGAEARHGYEALAELDSNSDGWVDEADLSYSELSVWLDLNRDGQSEQSELLSLPDAGVARLSTAFIELGRVDSNGNQFRFTARVIATPQGRVNRTWDVFLGTIRQ